MSVAENAVNALDVFLMQEEQDGYTLPYESRDGDATVTIYNAPYGNKFHYKVTGKAFYRTQSLDFDADLFSGNIYDEYATISVRDADGNWIIDKKTQDAVRETAVAAVEATRYRLDAQQSLMNDIKSVRNRLANLTA